MFKTKLRREERQITIKGITLRGLEVLEILAHTGSVAQTSEQTGLSQPAVSQQLRNLETALDVILVDRARRPMRLTPAGKLFLPRAQRALKELRLAQNEVSIMDLAHVKALSIGIIDDFDDTITPQLATILADSLTACRFRMITASSHDLMAAIARKDLHLAISAHTGKIPDGVVEYPLARDPFIIVAPKRQPSRSDAPLSYQNLPFLRYDKHQLIAAQIETHLTQNAMDLDDRFEIGSHQALMAMVARGIGWTITTLLGYMRAQRFHSDIQAHPLPGGPSARHISLFANADWSADIPRNVAQTLRRHLQDQMVEPAIEILPFLADAFALSPETE